MLARKKKIWKSSFLPPLHESGFQSRAPCIHPSIHPPAAFSNHPEAGAGVLRRRRQVRPLSNHGRSVARSLGRDIGPYEISLARCSRRREEGRTDGRKEGRKEGTLLTHASTAHGLRSLWGRPSVRPPGGRAAIQYRKSQTLLYSIGRMMQKHHHHHGHHRRSSGSANMDGSGTDR